MSESYIFISRQNIHVYFHRKGIADSVFTFFKGPKMNWFYSHIIVGMNLKFFTQKNPELLYFLAEYIHFPYFYNKFFSIKISMFHEKFPWDRKLSLAGTQQYFVSPKHY